MKFAIMIFLMSLSSSSFACFGEAQIVTQVAKYENTLMSCRAFVDTNMISFFSENQACPLKLSEIISKGIEVGLQDGHDCAVEIGEKIDGVVVKNAAGDLTIERK